IDAGPDRLLELGRGGDLDLDREALGVPLAYALDRGRDPAGGGDVVLLDQHHVVQPRTVVVAPARPDGRLLEPAPPRRGLPRVQDPGARPRDGVDVPARERRDAREALQEVERRSFAGDRKCTRLYY